jgi:hypothetical protein
MQLINHPSLPSQVVRHNPFASNSALKFFSILAIMFCVLSLTCCQSPEQKRKAKQAAMEKFCIGAVKHLLDHNPDTIRESITHLQREELTEGVFEKMQSEDVLPETELGVLKIIQEAQEAGTSNVIEVTSIKPVGDLDKDLVTFQLTGVETAKAKGKPDQKREFACTISCRLIEGYGQVVEVIGLGAPHVKPQPKAEEPTKSKKKRRRR